jgi:hypothetical protein
MEISDIEAHFLLFALDDYLGIDARGHIMSAKHGYSREALQSLRDRLFAAHGHPDCGDPAKGVSGPKPIDWPEYLALKD